MEEYDNNNFNNNENYNNNNENTNEAVEKVERITEKNNGINSFDIDREEELKMREKRREDAFYERQQKLQEKKERERGGKRRERGYGGWLAAIIGLSLMVMVLGTLYTASVAGPMSENESGKTAERSFYNFTEYVNSIDNDLNKLLVSNDEKSQQKLLNEITTNAALAEENLNSMPLKDESRYYTAKFVNQVGDFAKYLNNRLIDGLSLTETDKKNLESVYKINATLKSELQKLSEDMGEDFDFSTLSEEVGGDNKVLSKFEELESNAVDYPKLIYDGPFSDALETDEPVGLDGKDVSLSEAKEIFKKLFQKENIGDIEEDGETDCALKTYNFKAEVSDEVEIYASISKKGGKLVSFNYYADCSEENADLDECVQIATEFIAGLGIMDMKPVWATEAGSKAYINFAYEQDDVIVYKDMIKVTVCKERKLVSDYDAREYWLNHKKRDLGKASMIAKKAAKNLSTDIEVDSVRLAFIPYGEKAEILAYEFAGTLKGATYYIYVDAKTGIEAQIFRVVETTEGKLIV